jgi:hypothetical protein
LIAMTNPAGNVTVITEVGYCPFCRRTRNLRHEVRHLGALVRTNIDCESCHRTLSSTIGPPTTAEAEPEPKPEAAPEVADTETEAAAPGSTRKPAPRARAAKTTAAAPSTAKRKPPTTTKSSTRKKT